VGALGTKTGKTGVKLSPTRKKPTNFKRKAPNGGKDYLFRQTSKNGKGGELRESSLATKFKGKRPSNFIGSPGSQKKVRKKEGDITVDEFHQKQGGDSQARQYTKLRLERTVV